MSLRARLGKLEKAVKPEDDCEGLVEIVVDDSDSHSITRSSKWAVVLGIPWREGLDREGPEAIIASLTPEQRDEIRTRDKVAIVLGGSIDPRVPTGRRGL